MSWEVFRDSFSARNAVIDCISSLSGFSTKDLPELHNHIESEEVNSLRMMIYRRLNRDRQLKELFYSLCSKKHKDIVGDVVSYQVKINVSIQMPGDLTSVLPAHCDSWAGDSPYQVNAWIPITDCESSASMFVVERERSIELLRRLKNGAPLGILDNSSEYRFVEALAGDLVIFNGNYIHGNICNKTDQTRVSINFRFKSPWAPEYRSDFPDRSTPVYYEPKQGISEDGYWSCYDKEYSDTFVDITHG